MAPGRSDCQGNDHASGAEVSLQGKTNTELSGKTVACQGRGSDDALPVYSKETLLSVWMCLGTQATAPSLCALSETSLKFDSMSSTRSGTSSRTSEAPNVASLAFPMSPALAPEVRPPPGLRPPEEFLGEELMKEIGTEAALSELNMPEAASVTSGAAWRAPACSWGQGGKYSQILTRLRRAPGGKISLLALRQEAPHELRAVMRDGASFAAWLSHHTGIVEVCGAKGAEWVVLHTPHEKRCAAQFFQTAESCYFSGAARDSYTMSNNDDGLSQSDDTSPVTAGMAHAVYRNSENLTVADAHRLLVHARMALADASVGRSFGLRSVDDRGLQVRHEKCCPLWQQSDEYPMPWQSEWGFAWQGKESETSAIHQQQAVKSGGLNSDAAEFRPSIPLAKCQARTLDVARRKKATRKGKLWEASEVPDAIPEVEEVITCSEETASGDEDQATGSDATTINDDEDDSLLLALTS
eukprot:TRINITY_DN87509_c0_g1_i1.p1 TRINITY_DN87509_c0_g1~~TRINITY_DN87509_c0_g1_i1.p1  ORF type:complete len:493 (+),score=78.53 TRINITY_DN87509_c0_g1_i1:74-1480(+)